MNAVDYLLKPFDLARVSESCRTGQGAASQPAARPRTARLNRASNRKSIVSCACSTAPKGRSRSRPSAKLIVEVQSRLLLVDQAEICYAAIDEGVIRVVTRAFEGQPKCRTLEELMELLDPGRFWRAHRGFVVNIDQIREVMPWFKSSYQLRMNDKQQTEIPVSRAQTKRLRELFNL